MYIADTSNQVVRKVTLSTGIITTVAGTGSASYSGDNGPATSATLLNPYGVTLDSAGTTLLSNSFFLQGFITSCPYLYLGNVYIADTGNYRIRKVAISTGIITNFAGTGTASYSGDNGPATSATLSLPNKVALDSAGTHSHLSSSASRYLLSWFSR